MDSMRVKKSLLLKKRALFLDLKKGEQRKVLLELKNKLNVTWNEMANLLEVNRSMVFFYLRESSKLPIERIWLLNKKKGLDMTPFKYLNTKELPAVGLKPINEPDLDENLSEFLGILAGDGCVCETGHETSVTCGLAVDHEYVTGRVQELFIQLFKVQPTIAMEGTKIRCRLYSKKLKQFLSEKCDFPIGNRKNRTSIPKKISEKPKLLRCYLRGLFDTDGSFHRRRKNAGVVEYISCSPKFLEQIQDSLKSLGFSASLSGKSVYIYNQKQVDVFFKTIKPKNLKHITKYRIFKETGQVPIHREIIELMRPSSSG